MKPLTTYETMTENGLSLNGCFQNQLSSWSEQLEIGDQVEVVRKKRYPKKTHQQCKLYFGLLVKTVVEELQDRGWTFTVKCGDYQAEVPADADNVKKLLYGLFATVKDGKMVTISHMTTIEMTEFYDRCVDGLANGIKRDDGTYDLEPWFISVPSPDPEWKNKASRT